MMKRMLLNKSILFCLVLLILSSCKNSIKEEYQETYRVFEEQVDSTSYRIFRNSLESNFDLGIESVILPSNLEYFGFCGVFIKVKMDSIIVDADKELDSYKVLTDISSDVSYADCIIPDFQKSILFSSFKIKEINEVNCVFVQAGKFLKSDAYYKNAKYEHHGCSIGNFHNGNSGNMIYFILIW